MSLLGKILRSSTAVDQNVVSEEKTSTNLLEEFRPASVGVVSANSTDFVSLKEELYGPDNDLFQQDAGLPATNNDQSTLAQTSQREHNSSPQQQQHSEKEGNGWRDFTTPVIINNRKVVGTENKDRPTSRKLYLGITGTGTNESSGPGMDTDGHSDVRITYIGGSDRPGTTADRDALQTKKSFHRPTKSAGARPNALRVPPSLTDTGNGGGATSSSRPPLQRMSSFGGFEETPEYLADQYRITYRDASLERPPSRQGTAFPMDMDAAKRKLGQQQKGQGGGVDLADLDSDDDIFKANNRAQKRVSGRSIRSAPGRRYPISTGVSSAGDTEAEAAQNIQRNVPSSPSPNTETRGASAGENKERQASAGSQRGWTPAETVLRGLNDPERDGFTELGYEPNSGELPFKIHVQYGGKSKTKKSLRRKEKDLEREKSRLVYGGGQGDANMKTRPTAAQAIAITKKQRPMLEIIGTSDTKGTELKQTVETDKVEDCEYVNDDVSEEDAGDDKDTSEGDDEDEDEDEDEDDDEDMHPYTNEGNLAIQELDTNLDMDFLKLFASSISAATQK